VLVNLIRNAVEAMQGIDRPELHIRVQRGEGNSVIISVRDTGPGLSDEVAARLFQPFVTTKKTGMGVGLSICQSIVESHQGRIWATQDEDAGVTFHVSLPAAADAPSAG
jgi:two-component system sensor kinase FixL